MDLLSAALRPSVGGGSVGVRETLPNKNIISYTHTISAFGGFDTATMSFYINSQDIDKYLLRVIGSDINIYTGESEHLWQGFVNEVVVSYNGIDITSGPLMDLANKVLVRYTDFASGVPGITTYANDIISQQRYGTFVKILASAIVSPTNAENIRDNYLEDNRLPFYNVPLTSQPSENKLVVTLNCLGYYHLLSTYVYNNPAETVTTVREKIISILAAHPNSLFERTGLISSNNLSVPTLENEDRLAVDVIKQLVNLGAETTNDKMIFGIYKDFSVIYRQIPSSISYFYRSFKGNRYLTTRAGAKVHIGTLKPGQYVGVTDMPNSIYSGLRSVPRNIFIESVSYTYPFELSITGSNVSTLEQKLAKLGLSGF